jgi:hypothetical protein
VSEPTQAQLDAFEWQSLWPLDKPEPHLPYGTRWRYFRSLYNAPTMSGILLGVFRTPWMQARLGLA